MLSKLARAALVAFTSLAGLAVGLRVGYPLADHLVPTAALAVHPFWGPLERMMIEQLTQSCFGVAGFLGGIYGPPLLRPPH